MQTYTDIDWTTWTPVERATLIFAMRDEQVLLIHKKRGLGAGKVNGPGGRLDPGETSAQCAVREMQEEVCVTPLNPRLCGELKFQFLDGHSIHGLIYRADGIDGEPQETDEAIPFWCPLSDVPYGRMWMDDRLWFPLMLNDRYFTSQYLFDDDTMLGCEIMPLPHPPAQPPF